MCDKGGHFRILAAYGKNTKSAVFGNEKTEESAPSQRCSDHCRYSAKVSIEGAGKVLLSHAFAAAYPTVIWISSSFRRW